MKTWRYIESGAADGAFNMATDEALAAFCQTSTPIVRFYAWHPFTISIGYHQDFSDLNLEKCRHDGIDVVRRPTGGRAIYHAQEVTYSVIIPRDSALYSQATLDVYNQISSALVEGLTRLNLPLVLEKKPNSGPGFSRYDREFACFATSAKYEIHCQSKKLVGSAQRKFERALLQHGSIIVGDEHLKLVDYLATKNGEFDRALEMLRKRTISIERILNKKVINDDILPHLRTGFEKYFGAILQPDQLTHQELQKVNELKPKYTELRR